MRPAHALLPFSSAHLTLALVLTISGCGSSASLTADGGKQSAAGQDGGDASPTGDGGSGAHGAAGSEGAAGTHGAAGTQGAAGTHGAAGTQGAAGTGGTGGKPVGYCDTGADCVYHTVCCGGSCNAKTDPAPMPMVCSTSCVAGLSPATCGCVNHQCSSASPCTVPSSGLCPYCGNGYLTGPEGCPTCQCAPGDGGSDGPVCAAQGDGCGMQLGCCGSLQCCSSGPPNSGRCFPVCGI
jgi:hypothetical protein